MIRLPQIPESFWNADPVLGHIRRAAYSQPEAPSPDAVLGVCLCRVSALTPVEATLPGVGGSLNYLVAIVGPSGSGKSTSHRLARRLIPEIHTPLDGVGLGSGEGLIEAYLRREKIGDSYEKRQTQSSAYFYVDEAETVLNSDKRDGSTTLSTLRSMWSGSDVGTMNATTDTSRRLKDNTYRLAAAFGFQPEFALRFISDDEGGTPQRFLYVSAIDRRYPDVPSSDPGPLTIQTPAPAPIPVDPEVSRFIRERRRQIQRGEIELDRLDTHRDNLQQRTAALLSILVGSTDGVSARTWNMARELVTTSSEIISALREHEQRELEKRRATEVAEKLDRADMASENRDERISQRLGKWASENGPQTRNDLGKRLRGNGERQDRDYYIAEAIKRGYLSPVDNDGRFIAGPRLGGDRGHVDKSTHTRA